MSGMMSNSKRRQNDSSSSSSSSSNDDFLSSMTFASGSGAGRNCDCDECDGTNAEIPTAIAKAIRQHKKRRPLTRTQHRSLVTRTGFLTVWALTMPLKAEPLVEFGNSHRIVIIDSLPTDSCLVTIGKGVIGSSDEEQTRSTLEDWQQGSVFMIPYNGGKALGWIHSSSGSDASSSAGNCYATMYTIKIPLKVIESESMRNESVEWGRSVIDTCRTYLARSNHDNGGEQPWIQFNEEDARRLRQLVNDLQVENAEK